MVNTPLYGINRTHKVKNYAGWVPGKRRPRSSREVSRLSSAPGSRQSWSFLLYKFSTKYKLELFRPGKRGTEGEPRAVGLHDPDQQAARILNTRAEGRLDGRPPFPASCYRSSDAKVI